MRSCRLFLILNNWSRWSWCMHQMDQQCFGSNASPKWACVRCCVQVRRGRAQTWWSHAVGDAVWRQVSHQSVLWASYWNRSDHPPLQPSSTVLDHGQGVFSPLPSALFTAVHSSTVIPSVWNVRISKFGKQSIAGVVYWQKVFCSVISQGSHNQGAYFFQLRGKTKQHFSSHPSFPPASVSRCCLLCPQLCVLHQPAETKRLLVCFH